MSSSHPNLGKYQILEELGRGGMGMVYKGYDPLLDRTVAIKVLAPHLVWEQGFVERFMREARAAARLQHPNIIDIYDVGQAGNNYYFVMAYMPGPSLKQLIKQRGGLAPAEALPILHQLADALDYAHSEGLVHRDVKPVNVMFDKRNQAVLTDFGIVKAAQEVKLTSTGDAIGTPQYMAPEQVQGKQVNARTDQYALGIVAFEMLTGRVPFDADTPAAVFHMQMYNRPPAINTLCPPPGLPPATQEVMNRVLAKSPARRYGSCREFTAALEQALGPLTAPRQPQPSVPVAPEPPPEPVKIWTSLADKLTPEAVRRDGPASPPPVAAAPAALSQPAPGVGKPVPPSQPTPILVPPPQPAPTRPAGRAVPPAARRAINPVLLLLAGVGIVLVALVALVAAALWSQTRRTAAPQAAAVISPDNAGQVVELAHWGKNPNQITWAPSGKQLAMAAPDGIYFYDSQTLRETFIHTGVWVNSVAFSSDGTLLASGANDNLVKVWDLTGRELFSLAGHTGAVTSVAFSPDGTLLASGSNDKMIKIWEVTASGGRELLSLAGHTNTVTGVAFSPDGMRLASTSRDMLVKVWDMTTPDGRELLSLAGHVNTVTSLAFSPDGQTLASGSSDNTVKIWNIEPGGRELLSLVGHTGPVWSVAFSPGGRVLASGSSDKTVKLWDVTAAGGRELHTLTGHAGIVTGVAFAPDGMRLASASPDDFARLWGVR